ncbi:MAG TPA: hypothetical protein VE692_00835 [Nitrososphaera sp.]|nr:hypothetical protein [Nitrososphaera sp.]
MSIWLYFNKCGYGLTLMPGITTTMRPHLVLYAMSSTNSYTLTGFNRRPLRAKKDHIVLFISIY